ncbi:hypothetical protein N7456_007296 [Penicillium angulare]|uniref:Transcription factor n=1 Tax=Penicillium angulare TaxID=116970 RepID=A0A9W9FAC1_9EURO|nr:hypothetical protein N7456_007296 [Penicillium angulare]
MLTIYGVLDRNERVYQCPICQRGFNRRDVLQRHQAVHEKDGTDGNTAVVRRKERVAQACEACSSAKLSCDNARPCKRCQTKEIECVPKASRGGRQDNSQQQHSSSKMPPSSQTDRQEMQYPCEIMPLVATPNSSRSELSVHATVSHTWSNDDLQDSGLGPQTHVSLDDFLPPGSNEMDPFSAINQFPAFFEQVMLPGLEACNTLPETQQPRVFDFMQDNDITLFDSDIFGTDFMPELDKIFDATGSLVGFGENHLSPLDDQESASRRAAAFQRSLWLWVPEKNQHGFSEEQKIPLRDSDSIPSSHQTRLDALNIPGGLSSQARDDIFKLVLRTAGSRLSISAFPSFKYLDTLIKIGLGKRTETDAWFHLYTFYDAQYQQLRPELLTALVAAGCVCCGVPSICKTGIILQEISRVGLAQLVEEDNSVLQDLQYLQASMLWLDIGISCGYTRKMLISESYLQPLCTALRRAGAFNRSTYNAITPYSIGDDDASLQLAWHKWVRQESFKRLVYHLFAHDVEVTLSMNRPAITSYTEFTLPLPGARDLWLAPTATAWRDIWTSQYRLIGLSEINLRDLLTEPSLLSHVPPEVDSAIAESAILNGLALQVWEFRQQMHLSGSRATTKLWLQSRQEDLYSILKTFQGDAPDLPPVTILMNEFTMMYLHLDMDAIQRFVGKMGESEARRAFPTLREWSRSKDARMAIWHAGQVIRAARTVAPYQFRGFDSLCIYHSSLVLWVYGLLQCGEKRLQPESPISEAELSPVVTLDGSDNNLVKAFLNRGIGRPGLTAGQHRNARDFIELSMPRSVMSVVRQVFEGNCPLPMPGDIAPPMIQNLCSLIEDLGNLP